MLEADPFGPWAKLSHSCAVLSCTSSACMAVTWHARCALRWPGFRRASSTCNQQIKYLGLWPDLTQTVVNNAVYKSKPLGCNES